MTWLRLVLAVAALAAVLGVMVWGLSGGDRTAAETSEATRLARPATSTEGSTAVPYAEATVARTDTTLGARIDHLRTPLITHDQAEAFLDAQGRSAANLLAAFFATESGEYLDHASQAFPDDLAVLMLRANVSGISRNFGTALRQKYYARLLELEPDSAAVRHLRLQRHIEDGDYQPALELMDGFPAAGTWDQHDAPVRDAMTALLESAGIDSTLAGLVPVYIFMRTDFLASERCKLLTRPLRDSKLDPASKRVWAEALYEYSAALERARRSSWKPQSRYAPAARLKAAEFLAQTDSAWQARAEQVRRENEATERLLERSHKSLKNATDAEVRAYLAKLRTAGYDAAARWLAARQAE